MDWSERERRWWIAALAFVVFIYSTLYFVRGPVEFLRNQGLLRLTVGAVFTIAFLSALGWVVKRDAGMRELLSYLAFGVLFGGAVLLAKQPEEKLHFLEYGLLGGLLFNALSERTARVGGGHFRAVLAAIALAGLAGWGDEGIQAILPNRYYDLRDVLWNLLGSTIVVIALFVAAALRKGDSERSQPAQLR